MHIGCKRTTMVLDAYDLACTFRFTTAYVHHIKICALNHLIRYRSTKGVSVFTDLNFFRGTICFIRFFFVFWLASSSLSLEFMDTANQKVVYFSASSIFPRHYKPIAFFKNPTTKHYLFHFTGKEPCFYVMLIDIPFFKKTYAILFVYGKFQIGQVAQYYSCRLVLWQIASPPKYSAP